ncbi:MAG TPA: hypothetical protein VHQ92_07365 [Pseudolabrys sp.]|jgi:hypothetical protein|nr:hypothetical protein [Pseudolabrys sp.]
MNNLVIAFIAVAVAQALQLLLTIVREREIKRLRKLAVEQSIFINGWLTAERVHSGQPIADREPIADDTRVPEPAIAPKDLPNTMPPRMFEKDTARVMKVISWLNEAIQPHRMKPGGDQPMADAPAPAITPKDLPDTTPSRTMEEEATRAMEVISLLNEAKRTQPQQMKPDGDQPMADAPAPAITQKDLTDRPRLTEHEIKEMVGADKAREIVLAWHAATAEDWMNKPDDRSDH